MKIGIISDTHGKIPPEVYQAFQGIDQIWHAGDIGRLDVITELETIASVIAVYGNVDGFPLISMFRENKIIHIQNKTILLTHILEEHNLNNYLRNKKIIDLKLDAIIYGHTHTPNISKKNSTLFFNPGSVVLPRGKNLPSVGILTIDEAGNLFPELIFLKIKTKK